MARATRYSNVTQFTKYSISNHEGNVYYMNDNIKPTLINLPKIGAIQEINGVLVGWYSEGIFKVSDSGIKTINHPIKDIYTTIEILKNKKRTYVGSGHYDDDTPPAWFDLSRFSKSSMIYRYPEICTLSNYIISFYINKQPMYMTYNYSVHDKDMNVLHSSYKTVSRDNVSGFEVKELAYGVKIFDNVIVIDNVIDEPVIDEPVIGTPVIGTPTKSGGCGNGITIKSTKCAICFEIINKRAKLSPCAHDEFCQECANKIYHSMKPNCPLCRITIGFFDIN